MKLIVLSSAFAGLAFTASAQDFSLSLSGPTSPELGSVIIVEVVGDSSFGTHMLGGGFSLETNSSLIENITWNPASWSAFNEDNEGYLGNGNYGQVVFGQLLLPIPGFDVPAAGSELGGLIGTFEVEIATEGSGVIDFSLVASTPFTLEAVDVNNGLSTAQDVDGSLTLNGFSAFLIPNPSVTALFAFAGLAASRRRRA
tara:strand:+ start:75147 stop:75743 length:597 start_codon:yes stop_codon:yes gene_type:complete